MQYDVVRRVDDTILSLLFECLAYKLRVLRAGSLGKQSGVNLVIAWQGATCLCGDLVESSLCTLVSQSAECVWYGRKFVFIGKADAAEVVVVLCLEHVLIPQ